ncbi:MAG TPA: hypothetical protein VK524_15350 [Polyangiaceae bacterium]|nr:hypothetical protein [Polyangiaceae bacterium]
MDEPRDAQQRAAKLRTLSERGDFSVCLDDDTPERVLLVARPDADRERAQQRLETLAAAHARAADSVIPRVLSSGCREGRPFIAFDCPAVTDFAHVLEAVGREKTHAQYVEAITLIDLLLTSLARIHELGLSVGALSTANLFLDASGQVYLIGIGDNVLAIDGQGAPLRLPDVCVAPDVAAGAPASAGGDLYAVTLLCRRLIPHVIFPPAAERVLQGSFTPEDYELGQLFAWSSLAILASHPARRPSFAEAIEKEHRAWELLGVTPDPAAFFDLMRRSLPGPDLELIVDEEITRVRLGTTPSQPLGSRRALRRILSALIERHRSSPGQAIAVTELVEAGWPGESVIPEAAANRVYVALSSLRKLGLDAAIERCDGGWRLTPSMRVRVDKVAAAAQPPPESDRAS